MLREYAKSTYCNRRLLPKQTAGKLAKNRVDTQDTYVQGPAAVAPAMLQQMLQMLGCFQRERIVFLQQAVRCSLEQLEESSFIPQRNSH